MGDDFETLKLRVARLETQNRRFKRAGSLVAVLLLTALVLGQAKPAKQGGVNDVVRARQFVLIDKDGRQRGRWATIEGGSCLGLLDKNERTRSLWCVDGDHSRLSLKSHNSSVGLEAKGVGSHVSILHPGGHVILLYATEADAVLNVGKVTSAKNSDSLTMKPGLGLSAEPSPSIVFWDKNENLRAVLGAFGTVTESTLLFFDKDLKVLFEAP